MKRMYAIVIGENSLVVGVADTAEGAWRDADRVAAMSGVNLETSHLQEFDADTHEVYAGGLTTIREKR